MDVEWDERMAQFFEGGAVGGDVVVHKKQKVPVLRGDFFDHFVDAAQVVALAKVLAYGAKVAGKTAAARKLHQRNG